MILVLGSKKYINNFFDKNIESKIVVNQYGKKMLSDVNLHFNKSHTKNLSILMFSKYPCGIDIENIKKYNELVANKICSEEEKEFLSKTNNKNLYFTLLFVLKESFTKCLGIGISINLRNISFVKENKINLNIKGYKIDIMHYYNYLIATCRKVI